VASDTTVFQDYTSDYYNIEDRQIIKLSLKDQVEQHKLKAVTEEKVKTKLAEGCDHYYTMEMQDEPECVNKALNFGARLASKTMVSLGGLEKYEDKLMKVESLILAACGTSHFATKYMEVLLKKLGCFNYVECKIASEITA
jgi:glucosamine--fructose-6-phosphate aminotransferase (isomerizing)